MKGKISGKSLIFPAITFLWAVFMLLAAIKLPTVTDKIITAVYAAAAAFPLISVVFLRTDISRCVRWQGIFFAAGLILFIIGLAFMIVSPFIAAVLCIIDPVSITVISIALYAKIFSTEPSGRFLKWLTAFLSTPSLWLILFGVFVLVSMRMGSMASLTGIFT